MSNRTLDHLLADLQPMLKQPGVTDIVINRPGEVGVECNGEWTWYSVPSMTYDRLDAIGILCAYHTGQDIDARRPLCDTILPGGERLKVCRPPAVPPGTISLSIRVASIDRPTLEFLAGKGLFERFPLLPGVLRDAVPAKRNILICGAVGSGKTTLAKALIEEIPLHERLITIEDTPELTTIPHRNWLSLLYSKGSQSAATTTCEDLLETSLRSRPDRVLMGELRDGAAWPYLRSVVAGHPGCITTLHAGSASGAFDALRLMVRQNSAGATLADDYVRELLRDRIDIVAHCERQAKTWRVTDAYLKEAA